MMEPCSIETASLRSFQKDPMHCLELVFRYPLLDGNIREHTTFFHVIPHENYIRPLAERATALLERGGLSEEEIRCIQYQLNTVTRERESTPETFVQWEPFHEYLDKMEEGSYLKSLNEAGFHTLYMHSKLDDSVIYYHVCLPDGYRPDKRYPLLISFSILQMDDTSKIFAGVRDLEDVIVADIHGRGITMGSYIGDASIKEILDYPGNGIHHFGTSVLVYHFEISGRIRQQSSYILVAVCNCRHSDCFHITGHSDMANTESCQYQSGQSIERRVVNLYF